MRWRLGRTDRRDRRCPRPSSYRSRREQHPCGDVVGALNHQLR